MLNNIKIKSNTYNGYHENTSIEFTGSGMMLYVSLNIPNNLVKFLDKDKVKKGSKRYSYFVKFHIPSDKINYTAVDLVHKRLVSNCMVAIRKAKKKQLDYQINKIKGHVEKNKEKANAMGI